MMMSNEEVVENIKELLDNRPGRPGGPDMDTDFENLFDHLKSLAESIPEDAEDMVQALASHPRHPNVRDNSCFRHPHQFGHFMKKVKEVMRELHDEYITEMADSKDVDVKMESTETPEPPVEHSHDDSHHNSTEHHDADDAVVGSQETPAETSAQGDTDTDSDTLRKKRDAHLEWFDLDEVLDRLEDDDMECLMNFVSPGDKRFMCHRFAHRSSRVFGRLLSAGVDCEDFLMEKEHQSSEQDDAHDDAALDESQQMAILNRLKQRANQEWDENDVRNVMNLAPDVIDDDFVEELPERLFNMNTRHLGRLALRRGGNPKLRFALRKRLGGMNMRSMTSQELRSMGPGLLSLRLDQIEELDGSVLLEADIDDMFDDEDEDDIIESSQRLTRYSHDQDDEEDDSEDDVRIALGRKMRHAGIRPSQIGRAMRFLHDDLDFVRGVDPDDLMENLNHIRNLDMDEDDARAMLMRMSQSVRFPRPGLMTAQNLTNMGHLLKGMGLAELRELDRDAMEDALDCLKDVDFDMSQAEEILEELVDDNEVERFDVEDVRRFGRLTRGMPTHKLMMIDDNVINDDMLDELDDLDLSDAQKRIIAHKALMANGNQLKHKFMELEDFAEVLSIDDLEDLDIQIVRANISASARLPWRQSQAAMLCKLYRQGNGGRRLRPSDIAMMGYVAKGLLPEDLDEIAESLDDVMNIAEELKGIHEELSSGQIDELVERFTETSDLGGKDVIIDEHEALQAAYLLAYLRPAHFDKLEFSKTGRNAFVTQVAKMATRKMARGHMTFLASRMLDMMDESDNSESGEESETDSDSRRLRSLGHMALGLTPEQIRDLDAKAIIDNLDTLRSLPLTPGQALAVLQRVQREEPEWRCRSDVLGRLGALLQFHEDPLGDDCDEEILSSFSAVMKSLEKHKEKVQERLNEGFERESTDLLDRDGIKRLVNAMVMVSTTQMNTRVRRRRNAHENALTCDIVQKLKDPVTEVDFNLLGGMSDTEFTNCLPTLGSISDWSKPTLDKLASKAKMVFANPSNWTNEIIRRAGSIVAGLPVSEIQQMAVTGVDAMNSVAKHAKLTALQLRAGFKRWMENTGKGTDVTKISDGEFSALSEFVCGLDAAQVDSLLAMTFKRALSVIGQTQSCPKEILQAYTKKAMDVYSSNIANWEPAIVGDMGHLLGALQAGHMKKLTRQQLAMVSPTVIQMLPTQNVAAFTVPQLLDLSTNQVNAVTQPQFEALTSSQKDVLERVATVTFETGTNQGTGDDNGSQSMVATSAMLALLAIPMVLF